MSISKRPTLTPAIVADDDALWAAIDEAVRSAPDVRQKSREIIRRQEELRALVDEAAWQAYLVLEGATNARLEVLTLTLVRWAFEQWLRCGGQRRGSA